MRRRDLLRYSAAGLLAAPFVHLLNGIPTVRAGGNGPKRLFVFFSPNGTIPHRLWPSGGEADFTFAPDSILAPLEPIRDLVTVIKGLNFHNATNHEGGMAAMLTNNGGGASETGGRSLDQVIAGAIGDGTRFPSLELGVQTSAWGGSTQTRMCYAGPSAFVTPDDNPTNVYQRMFGDLLEGEVAGQRRKLRRRSVLDIGRAELVDLHQRVGAEERVKLQAHLAAIEASEASLNAPALCEPGAEPSWATQYESVRK